MPEGFDQHFNIERAGISLDRARLMLERFSREERPCLSCGETFTASDSLDDNNVLHVAIFCADCSNAGISKRSVPEMILAEWLTSYGPNRKHAGAQQSIAPPRRRPTRE